MKTIPGMCKCTNCECGIYTYEDSGICKTCRQNQHIAGAKRIDYSKTEPPKKELSL